MSSDTFPPGGPDATARALAHADAARSVVLVEGLSDQIALEALAPRRGIDLGTSGIAIVPIGGAQAIGRFLGRFAHVRLGGLCDEGEEAVYRRALDRAVVDGAGFHVCRADLEDELIRALGADRALAVVDAEGDGGAFATFSKQPAWRGRGVDAQLRRFLGSADRRKTRYARAFVAALELDRVPEPLDRVLEHAADARFT